MLAEYVSLPCPCQSSIALIRRWERRSGWFRRGKIGLVWTRGEDEEGGDPSRSVPADRRKTLQSIVSQPQWDEVGVDEGVGGGGAKNIQHRITFKRPQHSVLPGAKVFRVVKG